MMNKQSTIEVFVTIKQNNFSFYTTLLQSGIDIKSSRGETMVQFLNNLPGFTLDFISTKIETIFLNGTPVDDLDAGFSGENPVLAISASMPGLAGAIFRRNSIHTALRSDTQRVVPDQSKTEDITVTLKLFNTIALARGEDLLRNGGTLNSKKVLTTLTRRPQLLENMLKIQLDEKEIEKTQLLTLLQETEKITLTFGTNDG